MKFFVKQFLFLFLNRFFITYNDACNISNILYLVPIQLKIETY